MPRANVADDLLGLLAATRSLSLGVEFWVFLILRWRLKSLEDNNLGINMEFM
jgi:hypothetical protein